jgi:hypothetical protein
VNLFDLPELPVPPTNEDITQVMNAILKLQSTPGLDKATHMLIATVAVGYKRNLEFAAQLSVYAGTSAMTMHAMAAIMAKDMPN